MTVQGPRDLPSSWLGDQEHVHAPGADGHQTLPGQTAPCRAPVDLALRAFPPGCSLVIRVAFLTNVVCRLGQGRLPPETELVCASSEFSTGSRRELSFITIFHKPIAPRVTSLKANKERTHFESVMGSLHCCSRQREVKNERPRLAEVCFSAGQSLAE